MMPAGRTPWANESERWTTQLTRMQMDRASPAPIPRPGIACFLPFYCLRPLVRRISPKRF
eukprot:550076-Rhodomonas_salina.1